MPGEQSSHDLIRTKDRRSNSKADSFFINPKGLGNADSQVESLHLQTLTGDVTGSQTVETLAGSNLTISGNALTVASSAVYSDEKAQDAVGANYDSTLAYDDATPSFGVADGAIGTQQLNTPFTDLTTLHDTPVAVGASDLRFQDGQGIEDNSGQRRVVVGGVSTDVIDPDGDDVVTAVAGLGVNLEAYNGKPVEILDNQQGNPGIEYQTGTSLGTLFMRNADIDTDGNDIVDAGTTVYDGSTDTVGDGTTSADHQLISAEKIGNNLYFAVNFDGQSADSRLGSAITATNAGSRIILEKATYSTDRTISKELMFESPSDLPGSSSATVDATWTLNAATAFDNVAFSASAVVNADNRWCSVFGGVSNTDASFNVSADDFRYVRAYGGNINFGSGTSGGIVDGCAGTSVTDNGNNTVGDIA